MKKIDRLLEKMRKEVLKEDTRPYEGLWYFVYYKPQWVLEAFKTTEYGEMNHDECWEKFICAKLQDHYKVNPDKFVLVSTAESEMEESLRAAYTGMPRGRVTQGEKWVFYHGNDSPIPEGKLIKLLPAKFELTRHALEQGVKFEFDEHETMQEIDIQVVQSVLGIKIPYKKRTK
jgi:hypothetical protein